MAPDTPTILPTTHPPGGGEPLVLVRLSMVLALALLVGCPDAADTDDDSTAADDDGDDDTGDDDSAADDDSAGDDDSTPDDEDLDGDGWTGDDGDCDDSDPTVYPGAIDDLCDGINADCGWGQEILVPADYPSVQQAIDAATDGDRVCVSPGTYYEGISFEGKSIHVWGVDGPEETILQADGTHRVAGFTHGERPLAQLEGFTLTGGGIGNCGGGICIVYNSSPTLTDLIVTGNMSEYDGGGIHIGSASNDLSAPILRNVTISDNTAGTDGGGLYVDQGAVPVLEDLVVTDNYADNEGGGVSIHRSDVTLARSTIRHNEAGYAGGGIHLHGTGHAPTFVLTDLVIEGNRAGADGGGIDAVRGVLQLTRVWVIGNEAANGGGVFINGTGQAGDSVLDMEQAVIAGNVATWGGGLATLGASASLSRVSVVGNTASEDGGGAFFELFDDAVLHDTVIAHNAAGGVGGGLYCDGCTAELTYSDVWGNTPTDVDGLADPFGQYGNVSVDPAFIEVADPDPLNWDLHLALTSPLIDAGDPGQLDPDGSPSDVGAYGGVGAGGWDMDLDGFPEWWQPGEYDFATYPGLGWDCDDLDPWTYPGATDYGGNGVDEDCDGADGP